MRGDGRDLPGVVGLEAADRDQRVGALGQHVGDDVLQLAGLVAAEGQPGAARPRAWPRPTRRRGARSAGQRVHRARPEGQRVAGELVKASCGLLGWDGRSRSGAERLPGLELDRGGRLGVAGGAVGDQAVVQRDRAASGERARTAAARADVRRGCTAPARRQRSVAATPARARRAAGRRRPARPRRRPPRPRRERRRRGASRRGRRRRAGRSALADGERVHRRPRPRASATARDSRVATVVERPAPRPPGGLLQAQQRLAHGRAAHAEPDRQLLVAQLGAGGRVPSTIASRAGRARRRAAADGRVGGRAGRSMHAIYCILQ